MKPVEQFVDLVKRMRSKQKEYFRTRSKDIMIEAKQLEYEVDKMLQVDIRYCNCPPIVKHGETSAMHCNECGGLEQKETWLK